MSNPPQPPPGGGAPLPDIHTPFTRTERIEQLAEIDKDIASLLTHLSSAMRALATPPNTNLNSSSNLNPGSSASFIPATSASDSNSESNESPFQEPPTAASDPQAAFQTAQTNFFNTIDRVGKHLDRNIFALEEAGIISLRSTAQQQQQQEGGGGGSVPGSQSQLGSSQGGGSAGGGSFNSAVAGGAGGDAAAQRPGVARLEPDGAGHFGRLDVGKLNMASSTLERDKEVELWRRAREFLERIDQQRGDRMQE
ncbi:mediator complex, subunit Med11 [Cladorrhinum sp. PSN332]|nr:mediator complex, subunit Med11 [Cladorrhinum sp. PSN332]